MDAALLAEISANPDDDAPRLVYADLLVERGDPRGELIHLQIKQTRERDYRPDLDKRVTELLQTHAARWKQEAGITGCLSNIFRGFPASLIGSAVDILACRDALRGQPITSLSILSRLSRLDELMQLPELAGIEELTISGEMLGYGGHAALTDAQVFALASAALPRLRTLHIEGPALETDGAQILAMADWLPRIEKLVLGKNPFTAAGAIALAPRLAAIKHLTLNDVDLRGTGDALAAIPSRQLDFLYLENAYLQGAAIPLVGAPVFASVRHLDLSRTVADDATAIAIATSPHATNLQVLVLANGVVGIPGARALAASTSLVALERLDLRDNLIEHAGLAHLAASTQLPALTKLGVTGNKLGTGRWESNESDEYGGSYEVGLTREEIATQFAHRPGLVIE
jgi:uncharacterized protein (TIGR02996 family)